jgi:hypothetical protein
MLLSACQRLTRKISRIVNSSPSCGRSDAHCLGKSFSPGRTGRVARKEPGWSPTRWRDFVRFARTPLISPRWNGLRFNPLRPRHLPRSLGNHPQGRASDHLPRRGPGQCSCRRDKVRGRTLLPLGNGRGQFSWRGARLPSAVPSGDPLVDTEMADSRSPWW